jgi:hypothetical protein
MTFPQTAAEFMAAFPSQLCCDLCDWPMAEHEVVRAPDGAIEGLLVCSVCLEDALAADQPEHMQ